MADDLVTHLTDLTRLAWSERANMSGMGGTFLKSRETTARETTYYKMSCYDSYRGVYGHECVNELVASRLMGALGVDHVPYRLVHARVSVDGSEFETWLSASANFRAAGEKKIALDTFYGLHRRGGESPLELMERFGWREQMEKTMVVDYLLANRDRHGANTEVIRGADGAYRLAPVFDTGLSLVFSCYGDEERVVAFDPLSDVAANNFIGTRSLEENLAFVRRPLGLSPLVSGCEGALFAGLDGVLPQAHLDKMWEIIRLRWNRLVDEVIVVGEAL